MSVHSLTIVYSGPAAIEDSCWLRLAQDDVAEDVATVDDAAAVLDALYHLDPCAEDDTAATEATGSADTLTADDVTAAAQEALDTPICDQDADGSVEVKVRVILSHPDGPYRLRVSGGEVLDTIVIDEIVTRTITVQQATSAVLDYPIVGTPAIEWRGAVVTKSSARPAIQRTGNTLHWQGQVTGAIRATYRTRTHQARIKVHGIDGAPGAATVRCFWHGLVEEIEPVLPDAAAYDRSLCEQVADWNVEWPDQQVTCYQSVALTRVCGCSGREIDRRNYDQVVPCPPWAPKRCPNERPTCMHLLGTVPVTEYVHCAEDGDNYADPEFYREVCCGGSRPGLPPCAEEKRSWRGGAPIERGTAYWRGLYGKGVRLVPVLPPGGICGEWTIRQELTPCCDDISHPVLPRDNVAAPGTLILIQVSGGMPPYQWSADGSLSVEQVSADTLWAWIRADDDFCGSASIGVIDGCGHSAESWVRSTDGRWIRQAVADPFTLPDGFVPGAADSPGVTDLCGGSFSVPATRTDGQWRVNVGYSGVGFANSGCPEVPGDAGAITLVTGLGMHPYQAMCARYTCWGSSCGLSGSCCGCQQTHMQYVTYYQRIAQIYKWEC